MFLASKRSALFAGSLCQQLASVRQHMPIRGQGKGKLVRPQEIHGLPVSSG